MSSDASRQKNDRIPVLGTREGEREVVEVREAETTLLSRPMTEMHGSGLSGSWSTIVGTNCQRYRTVLNVETNNRSYVLDDFK